MSEKTAVAAAGTKIRQRRKLLGKNTVEFAPLANISPQYLGQIERGQRDPSPGVFARICDALGVAAEDRHTLLADGPDTP